MDTSPAQSTSTSEDHLDFPMAGSSTQGLDNMEDEDDAETYYFESDHVALKGNPDYQAMLRTIAVLEAQRIQAVKDLDTLYEAKEKALANPIQFVQKLQSGANLNLPKTQKIMQLPNINWEKYTSNLDFSSLGAHRHMTRLKKHLSEGNNDDNSSGLTDEELVRGRIKTEDKPISFNQLWTTEEQKRLEELLLQHPPEEVEARRWQKIASALGNRTPIQVQSRVQKYFIKLAKAGLPIPGRQPNLGSYKKKTHIKHNKFQRYNKMYAQPSTFLSSYIPPTHIKHNKFQRYNKMYAQPSTFLSSYIPPVYMSDDDSSEEGTANSQDWETAPPSISDDESVPVELRDSQEYRELLHLKSVYQMKLQHNNMTEHVGFKCDNCDCEPIVGIRWHCTDCPPDVAVDFCDECVDRTYETETHNSSHRLKPKHRVEESGFTDTDYMGFIPGGNCSGYNYLDPNYMPANS